MKTVIQKKLNYLTKLHSDNPRIKGHIFELKMASVQEFDYKKKLDYLKSMDTENEYIRGQIDALTFLVDLEKEFSKEVKVKKKKY